MKKTRKPYLNILLLSGWMSLCLIFACTSDEGNKEASTVEVASEQTEAVQPVSSPKKLSLGEKAFILCQACHNTNKGEPHKVGPNLHGIFGRKAGTAEGFTYSESLKNSGIVWDETHLRNWLEKPTDYIPGTTMAFIGIQDEAQQTALIEHLQKLTQE